jgi:hypothetical protein
VGRDGGQRGLVEARVGLEVWVVVRSGRGFCGIVVLGGVLGFDRVGWLLVCVGVS